MHFLNKVCVCGLFHYRLYIACSKLVVQTNTFCLHTRCHRCKMLRMHKMMMNPPGTCRTSILSNRAGGMVAVVFAVAMKSTCDRSKATFRKWSVKLWFCSGSRTWEHTMIYCLWIYYAGATSVRGDVDQGQRYLQQSSCRISLQALPQFVHLIQEKHRVIDTDRLQTVDDASRHAPHVCASGKKQ